MYRFGDPTSDASAMKFYFGPKLCSEKLIKYTVKENVQLVELL